MSSNAAVDAASAAFRGAVQEVYGDEVAAGQEQLTLDSRVAKVGSIEYFIMLA